MEYFPFAIIFLIFLENFIQICLRAKKEKETEQLENMSKYLKEMEKADFYKERCPDRRCQNCGAPVYGETCSYCGSHIPYPDTPIYIGDPLILRH